VICPQKLDLIVPLIKQDDSEENLEENETEVEIVKKWSHLL
jgi:hypothetical protein